MIIPKNTQTGFKDIRESLNTSFNKKIETIEKSFNPYTQKVVINESLVKIWTDLLQHIVCLEARLQKNQQLGNKTQVIGSFKNKNEVNLFSPKQKNIFEIKPLLPSEIFEKAKKNQLFRLDNAKLDKVQLADANPSEKVDQQEPMKNKQSKKQKVPQIQNQFLKAPSIQNPFIKVPPKMSTHHTRGRYQINC